MKKVLSGMLLMLLPVLSSAADDVPWWKFWAERTKVSDSASTETKHAPNLLFTEEEKQRLREYLRASRHGDVDHRDDDADDMREHKKPKEKGHKGNKGKQKPLPPGLQKKVARGGELPPGWQKKVARGEVIDGELYSQSQPLPSEWAGRLRNPEGTETRVIGDRVFRVMRNTREILDVLGQ